MATLVCRSISLFFSRSSGSELRRQNKNKKVNAFYALHAVGKLFVICDPGKRQKQVKWISLTQGLLIYFYSHSTFIKNKHSHRYLHATSDFRLLLHGKHCASVIKRH